MKHLRKYNESKEDISIEDIKDICQELEDEGFSVRIIPGIDLIYINICLLSHLYFQYKDVKETVLRLKDYLGDI